MRIPIGNLQLAVRSGLAASVSLGLGRLIGLEYPVYALLASVIVTEHSPSQTRTLGLRRLVATVIGALCGAVLSTVLSPVPWAVGLSVLVAMLLSLVLHAPEVAKVAGYTCGIVVLSHGPERWSYATSRMLETALGITVAWLVSHLPKLIRIDDTGVPSRSDD